METKQRSRIIAGTVVAGVVVIVALVAALVIALVSSDGKDDAASPPTDTTSPPPGGSGDPAPPSRSTAVDPAGRKLVVVDSATGEPLPQSGTPEKFPSGGTMPAAPEGLQLQQVTSGTTLMVSTSDGPTGIENGTMTGYARSPGGAALLTANYVGLGLEMGVAYADFIERFAPAVVQEDPKALEDIRERGKSTEGKAVPAAQGFQAPRWVRFSSCDETFCTVEVAMPSVSEAVGQINSIDIGPNDHPVFRASLTWTDGGWTIVSGRSMPPVTDIDGTWLRWT